LSLDIDGSINLIHRYYGIQWRCQGGSSFSNGVQGKQLKEDSEKAGTYNDEIRIMKKPLESIGCH
jgi:hypothetical protein